jgi:hypothetical protein
MPVPAPAAGVTDMLAVVLGENPGLEVVRAAEGAWRVGGAVEPDGAGWIIEVRVVDPDSAATIAAERIAVAGAGELMARVGALAAKLSAQLGPGAPAPALASLTTASADAYQAYLEGGEGALRRAIALDPAFVQPRLRLAALLGGSDEARALVAAARPLAARAGAAAALALRRLDARTPEELVAVLAAERDRAPHDLGLAAELAGAYRRAGRVADCIVEGERAGAAAVVDLVWCRLASGDAAAALDAAKASDDPVLLGDVSLLVGRFAEARDAYHRAGARAGARPALVALRAQGRCKTPVRPQTVDDARVAALLAVTCGDWEAARAAEGAARRLDPRAADDLALARAVARGEPGTFERARARATDAALWSADGLDRGRRYGPLFAAARAEGQRAVLDGFVPAPSDRWALFEEPLLYEVALAHADLGSADDAALACAELAAADAPVGLYCQGRAAEAAHDWTGAFQGYRAFLDRFADADADHRLVRDATRRIRAVVMHARTP